MPQRSARFQYTLLALVAILSLTHFYLGAVNSFQNLLHGTERVGLPFYTGGTGRMIPVSASVARLTGLRPGAWVPTITLVDPAAQSAGLHVGDAVYAVNGRPFTGFNLLLGEIRHSHAGAPIDVTFWHAGTPLDAPPLHAIFPLSPERKVPPRPFAWIIQNAFLFLPFFCLLTGLYVAFARPRSTDAWLILGMLSFFAPVFIPAPLLYGPLMPVAMVWSILAQTAMPICLMAFGIYFPDRSVVDRSVPWLKWLFVVPMLALLPADFIHEFSQSYNFNFGVFVAQHSRLINNIENIAAGCAISYFFAALFPKLRSSTGDARRRLRVLYYGTFTGLTPLLILVIISAFRGVEVGLSAPQWVVLTCFGLLLFFPLSLAYVVVVQRAMDVRILVRQGTKYFFARNTVRVLLFGVALILVFNIKDFIQHPGHQRNVDIVRLLGIAALFLVLRKRGAARLQQTIDRRFFREAYSAEQVLSDLSDKARNFTETAPLLDTITHRIGDTLHIQRIAIFLRTGDTFTLQHSIGDPQTGPGSPLSAQHVLSLPAAGTTISTLTAGREPATVYRDDPSSWLVEASDHERQVLHDLATELLVPLPGRNRLIGVMALGPKRSQEPYSKSDRQLLYSVASQTGLALENAELLDTLTGEIAQRERVSSEIDIAREVQQRLFPQTYPKIAGFDMAGFCRPAQAVGGDYYDFFALDNPEAQALARLNGQSPAEPRLGIAIGDISGKGISAALLMASLRASLRSAAMFQMGDLAALMRHVNRLVYDASTSNRYATFFYAEFDPASRLLSYVNAGHNAPYILRGQQVIPLEATGTVVGLLREADYESATIPLNPGDVLLAFTDGISEAMTHQDEEWGEERMVACAQTLLHQTDCSHTADQLLTCILTQADAFTAGAPQHDDMTLLVCALSPAASPMRSPRGLTRAN